MLLACEDQLDHHLWQECLVVRSTQQDIRFCSALACFPIADVWIDSRRRTGLFLNEDSATDGSRTRENIVSGKNMLSTPAFKLLESAGVEEIQVLHRPPRDVWSKEAVWLVGLLSRNQIHSDLTEAVGCSGCNPKAYRCILLSIKHVVVQTR